MKITYIKIISFIFLGILILPFSFALASESNGTVDSTYKYAWSENIGWINFGCDNCNVSITDSAITGYAWSNNYGWINLNPSSSGVANDGEGNLSGQAWGENTGWIDFSGVTVDSSGYFNGYASGNVTGNISFNCANTGSCSSSDFKVSTDWRPTSSRTSSEQSSGSSSNGGGVIIPGMFDKPKTPLKGFKVMVNGGANTTDNRTVSLSFDVGSNVKKIAISNTDDFKDASQESYIPIKQWDLCSKFGNTVKLQNCTEGKHTVYVKFYTQFGRSSQIFSDDIVYNPKELLVKSFGKIVAVKFFKSSLHLGDTGEDVKMLQHFLNKKGFILSTQGSGSLGNETKYFGRKTFQALKQFQEKYKEEILIPVGLKSATGFFGPSTRLFANSNLFKKQPIGVSKIQKEALIISKKDIDKTYSNSSFIFTKTLRLGMENDDIKKMQQLLNLDADTKLIENGVGSRGNETKYFGALTKDAVQRFQAKYNIVSSGDERTTGYGLVGPKTRVKLQEVFDADK